MFHSRFRRSVVAAGTGSPRLDVHETAEQRYEVCSEFIYCGFCSRVRDCDPFVFGKLSNKF